MRRQILIYMAMLLLPLRVHAADTGPTVTSSLSGDTLKLSDGTTVHLDGVLAPGQPKRAKAAQQELQNLTSGKSVAVENPSTDRYGQLTGQTYISDKQHLWLQGQMLRDGMVFVYPPAGYEARLDEMRKAEQDARKAKRGIWGDEAFADTPADKADDRIGSFAFVTGKVFGAVRVKNKVYLNFGPDWHTDFTGVIAARDLHAFQKAGMNLLALKGRMVRLRGWVIRSSGPAMNVTAPGQIDILN